MIVGANDRSASARLFASLVFWLALLPPRCFRVDLIVYAASVKRRSRGRGIHIPATDFTISFSLFPLPEDPRCCFVVVLDKATVMSRAHSLLF
jgi:hypothetical protein